MDVFWFKVILGLNVISLHCMLSQLQVVAGEVTTIRTILNPQETVFGNMMEPRVMCISIIRASLTLHNCVS